MIRVPHFQRSNTGSIRQVGSILGECQGHTFEKASKTGRSPLSELMGVTDNE